MDIIDDVRYPTIIPIMSNIMLLRTTEANIIIMIRIKHAPKNAPNTINIELDKLKDATVPDPIPSNKTTRATPKLAPALIPNIPESAKGLRNVVCNNNPDTAIAPPVKRAVIACGKRDSSTICIHALFCTVCPSNIFTTASIGIETEPKNRFAMNSKIIILSEIILYLRPLCIEIQFY